MEEQEHVEPEGTNAADRFVVTSIGGGRVRGPATGRLQHVGSDPDLGASGDPRIHLRVADPIYAHVTATNVSSASCNMRGASEAQILNAGGTVIADAGTGAATVKSSDPVYALAPNGTINTIVQWGNWCKAAPTQNLKVAMVEPFGLGRIVAPANGVANVPACSASVSATVVSSEAWLP